MDAIRESMRRVCQQAELLGLTKGSNVVPIWTARRKPKPRTYTRPMPPYRGDAA